MERYKVTKVLGDGSYGSVLRAQNKSNGEWVAIKKMKQKYHSWEECMKLREISSLRKLNHPNIVKLKEVIRENDELHLVFEFCDANLVEYMKVQQNKGRPLPESKVRHLMNQTLQAVHHVHRGGFFHRDLKPDNLLVIGETVKLADFGLAREIRARPPYTEYVSTRWYRAPEVLLRSGVYNSPLDMWAVGAIMAELFLLRPLMPGESETDQLFKICSVLGTPAQAEWPEGFKLASRLGFKFPQLTAPGLEVLVPQGSPAGLDVIGALLQWDPNRRPAASKVLQHPFFEVNPLDSSFQLPQLIGEEAVQPDTSAAKYIHEALCKDARGLSNVAASTQWSTPRFSNTTSQSLSARHDPDEGLVSAAGSSTLQREQMGSSRSARRSSMEQSAREWCKDVVLRGSTDREALLSKDAPSNGSSKGNSHSLGFNLPSLPKDAEYAGGSKNNSHTMGFNLPSLPRADSRKERRECAQTIESGKRSPASRYLRMSRYQPGMPQAPSAAVQSALDRWGR